MPIVFFKPLLFAAVFGLTGWGLHALKEHLGLAGRYYLLVGTTAWLALMVFNVPMPWLEAIPGLGAVVSCWHIALWWAVCWHSAAALFHPARIPVLLALPCLVVSGIFCCMMTGAALLWVATGGVGLSI
ncbi:hypothetical protein [Hymenobacter sp. B1770]|uniref:hypothetical protein n=1 Tax=Hymenobacter sp. B1770 TaxID=1718788 RepID=UPI003CEDB1EE